MKIYASTSDNWFDPYVGKDIWVKCKLIFNLTTEYWIRFIEIDSLPDGISYVTCNYVAENFFARNNPLNKDLDRPRVSASYLRTNKIQAIEPIETKTTEELFGISGYTIDGSEFARFVGKDVWVAATSYSSDRYGDPFFINIDTIDGNVMHYAMVEADIVNPESMVDSYGPPSESIMESRCVSSVDQWELIHPIEVLTAEEVDEAIDLCDHAWEEVHMYDDYDDEDEE